MNHHLSFILTKHPNKSWGILGGQGEKFTNPQPTNRSKPTQTCWKHDLTYRDAWNLFVLYFLGWKKKLQKPDKKNPIKTAGAPFGFQVGMVHSQKKHGGNTGNTFPKCFLVFGFPSLPDCFFQSRRSRLKITWMSFMFPYTLELLQLAYSK